MLSHFGVGAAAGFWFPLLMTNLFRRMLLAALLAGVLTGSAWAQTRVATVDLRKLFEGYWKTKQASTAIDERFADLNKEAKGLRDDYQKLKEDYQKLLADANDQTLSAEERGKRKQAAEGKLKNIKETEETVVQFERQARTTLDEQKRRMRDNILSEIRTVVNAKAKAAGFALVVDTASESINGTPIFVYTSGENDLTGSVLTQLNAGAPVETPKPAEKKEEPKREEKK
jgi:outer membrane protein